MKTVLIPLKIKDTESVSWSKGLTSYLKRSYGSQQWSTFYDVDKTKEVDACRTSANSDLASESLLEQNYKYASILEQVYMRLGAQSGSLHMDFTWYEAAYRPELSGKKFKQHTVVFEKSAVMFNIGVLLRQIAEKKMADDYKSAVPFLTKAMSCFEYMSNNFLNSPSLDLSAESTSFLADLSHAEAQELFLLTLVNGSDSLKRASLISKLASTTYSLYEKCLKIYEKEVDDILASTPYGEEKWKSIITLKFHLYQAIAAFNHALVLEQSGKAGEAIAFARISAGKITDALIYKLYVKEDMDLESLRYVIDEKLKNLTKDNDFIYNDPIPSDAKLESIKTMDAVKPICWEDQLKPYMEKTGELCNAVFKGIVAMEVYENESIYSEEKASLLRSEVENVDTADWEYQSFVEFTDLPKLIKDLESKYIQGDKGAMDDPQFSLMKQQLLAWSKTIQNSKFKDIRDQMHILVAKRNEILSIISTINQEQRDNVLKIKSSLVQASQSDDRIFESIKPFIEDVNLLNNSRMLENVINKFQLQKNEPSLLDIDDDKNQQIIDRLSKIKENQETLRLLKEERARNLKDFKEAVNNDDITQKLILHRGKSSSDLKFIFEEELNKFKPLSSRIEATVFKQNNLINEIKIKLDEIFKMTGIQDKTPEQERILRERQQFYDKLENAYNAYVVYDNDLPKGINFYDTLLRMTRDLSLATAPSSITHSSMSNNNPPALPSKGMASSIEEGFAGLSLSGFESNTNQNGFTGYPSPENDYSNTAPPIPPKPLNIGITGIMNDQTSLENPTSFYNNPSVFDEKLYSRFSK